MKTQPNLKNLEELVAQSMEKTWTESEAHAATTLQQMFEYQTEATALLRKINRKKRGHWHIRQAMSIAASVLVLIAIGFGVHKYKHVNRVDAVYADVSTSYGETKIVSLPDGTTVTLNACSHISYLNNFDGDERRVKLEGEAYFEVARNKKQPFIIAVNQFDVNVLGTEFNVKAYHNDKIHTVDVNSGKVQVDMADATIRLVAQEHLAVDLLGSSYNKYKEPQTIAGWRKGELHFNRAPIRDVANELERIYHCKIEFKQGQVFDNYISGQHANPNLEAVLQSLEYTSGIHYKLNKNQVLLYK
ncbi:iron dicitrate transporter FecR [Bacteroidia bacterium]|nr:iron dicitrate transporter FecR [Bacteroidia bacterium]